jgi:hypothetical protein
MTRICFTLCLFCSIIFSGVFAQQKEIFVGTIESNFLDFEQDKQNNFLGVIYFHKNNNQWRVLMDSFYPIKQNFNVFYKGLKVGAVAAWIDTTITQSPYFGFPYKFANKKIPTIGKKTYTFSGMGGEKCYRPLIISNTYNNKQKQNIKFKTATKNDSLIVLQYLIEKAKEFNLGGLDSAKEKIIRKVNRVLKINNDCYFIDADINLNMYCYKDKVPFDKDLSYFLSSTQKFSIAERRETYNAYFLVNKAAVTYVDYDLKYLDSGDFDDDGYDEIVFRMDKYNYTGYLMVTNKWTDFFTKSWSYH